MSSQQHGFQRGRMDFEDAAFEPHASYDFENEVDHLGNDMAAFNAFHSNNLEFGLVNDIGDGAYGTHFHGHDINDAPGEMHPPMGGLQHLREPPSEQKRIVSNRSGHVDQHFGQITPPDEGERQPFKAPLPPKQMQPPTRSQSSGKLSNEQRARNAANTRHSRTKNAKKKGKGESEEGMEDEVAQKQSKNLNVQREKNRVAAAKCRAKKKTANVHQEEMANEFSSTHNYLTKEIRELKNQKTELQNYLLAHRPGVCDCHGIHEYNLGQAQRLVMQARRQTDPAPSTPSYESVFSGQSPDSDASGMMFSRPSPMIPSDVMGIQQSAQSFNGPMGYSFNQVANTGNGDPREFADFLHNSPGGRAGFS